MFKKRRKITAREIAIFIDGRTQHRTTVVAVPCRVIGAATKERNTKRRPADDH